MAAPRSTARARTRRWQRLSDEELLDLRFCDLGLQLPGTPVHRRVQRLARELEAKGLRFRPYVWLGLEWETPVGLTGFAAPFYLAHPRLVRLEKRLMLEAEGAAEPECMRILRHETGHAIKNAYRLGRRKSWRDVFGRPSQAYPDAYQPRPYSKRYVQHLGYWYAQAHPDEDFAETFAVWLTPRSQWRTRYAGWPALRKLEYVDRLMRELADAPPPVRTRARQDSVARVRTTLREHYEQRRDRYAEGAYPQFYDSDLRRLFAPDGGRPGAPKASAWLRRTRRDLRARVAYWTGQYQYLIDLVLGEMIDRCDELGLRRARADDEDLRRDAAVLLTVQTMNYLHSGRHRIAM